MPYPHCTHDGGLYSHLPDKLDEGLQSGHLDVPAIAVPQDSDEGTSYQHHHLHTMIA